MYSDPIGKKLGADRKRSTRCPVWSQKIRQVHLRRTNNRRKRPQTSCLNTKQTSKHGPKTSSRHNDALQPIRCQLRVHIHTYIHTFKGSKLYLADTLSRAHLDSSEANQDERARIVNT